MKSILLAFGPGLRLIDDPKLLDRKFRVPQWGPFPGLTLYVSTDSIPEKINEKDDQIRALERHVEDHRDQLRLALSITKDRAGL